MSVLNFSASLSDNGSTNSMNVPVSGMHVVYAHGDFGGGVVTVEASPDKGATWLRVVNSPDPFRFVVDLLNPELVRFSIAGATAPSVTCGVLK